MLPQDAGTLYYATESLVYRSIDGGRTFIQLPPAPGGAGTNHVQITSIDATRVTDNIIAVGTRDTDTSEFGGVYTLEDNYVPRWMDTGIGDCDVCAVAFSPNYARDYQLLAVMTDEVDTYTTSKIGDSGWSALIGRARLARDSSLTSSVVATNAAMAFPGDYNAESFTGSSFYFIAVDTGKGEGDVYKIGTITP